MNVVKDIMYLELTNDLDQHYVEMIRDDVEQMIKKERVRFIIMDFNKVTFMDSSGIGFIMGRYKSLKRFSGGIFVMHIGPGVERIFDISGLYSITTKVKDADEALKEIEEEKR